MTSFVILLILLGVDPVFKKSYGHTDYWRGGVGNFLGASQHSPPCHYLADP